MPDSDLQLTFGADASGLVQGVAQAKSAVAGLSPQVDALAKSFGGLGAQVKTGLGGLASLAGGLKQAVQDSGAQIAAINQDVSDKYRSDQQQEVAAAVQAGQAKVAASQSANRRIAEENDRALKQFEGSMKQVVNGFARGLAQMVEGGKSFGQGMREIGQQLLEDVFRVVVGMVEKWAWGVTERVLASQQGQSLLQALGLKDLALEIANDVRKTTSAVTGATAQTTAGATAKAAGLAQDATASAAERALNAQTAFSGAIAAISPIPFIGPSLAPGVAAQMASLASAAGGYDIPAGVNPLTQLHAREMVLPARLANPMRDMLAGFGGAGAPAPGGHAFSFGDTHIHGAPNMSPADFKQALAEHRAHVAEAVAGALRGGWRPSYRQPVGAL